MWHAIAPCRAGRASCLRQPTCGCFGRGGVYQPLSNPEGPSSSCTQSYKRWPISCSTNRHGVSVATSHARRGTQDKKRLDMNSRHYSILTYVNKVLTKSQLMLAYLMTIWFSMFVVLLNSCLTKNVDWTHRCLYLHQRSVTPCFDVPKALWLLRYLRWFYFEGDDVWALQLRGPNAETYSLVLPSGGVIARTWPNHGKRRVCTHSQNAPLLSDFGSVYPIESIHSYHNGVPSFDHDLVVLNKTGKIPPFMVHIVLQAIWLGPFYSGVQNSWSVSPCWSDHF